MSKYAIWDKTSDIYTLGKEKDTGRSQWSAQEYIATFAPWANNPNVKVIVGGGTINGVCFMELDMTVESYQKMGADFTGCATPEDKLSVIEAFEDAAPVDDGESSAEERIAAALEYQNLLSMTVVNEDDPEVIL